MIRVFNSGADRQAWLDVWAATGREPFAHPSYVEAISGAGDRPIALAIEVDDGLALVPLLLRSISIGGIDAQDAISPYGYGGPFMSGDISYNHLFAIMDGWARALGLCSLFMRLSLDFEPQSAPVLPPGVSICDSGENVIVDLSRSEDELWSSYDRKVRKNVRKSLRGGCQVSKHSDASQLDAFIDVYGSTMERRGARSWYRFSEHFFRELVDGLMGSFSIFTVSDEDGDVVSAEMVLESDAWLYSFLGGTKESAFHLAPNDLLKHEVAVHGIQTERRGYVLGGGYGRDDGIFRYKRSFDPTGVRTFRTARFIGDQRRYDDLVEAQQAEMSGELEAGFFPQYRAEAVAAPDL